jgi:signal transduction histidine kinase
MAEEDLLERLQSLFMHAPVAIAVNRGPQLVYQLANDVYRQFLGGRDLIGRPLAEILPEQASLRGILERMLVSGETYTGKEFPFLVDRRGEGFTERAWFNFICQPTHAPDGTVDGVITFAVEVTDHVQARMQIESMAAELRQAVVARDEFISVASHELRTPLTPLFLQVQMLRKHSAAGTVPQPELVQRLGMMERSIERMTELIDQLLDVSRITANRLDLSLGEVDLVALARDAVQRQKPALDQSGSTLSFDAPPSVSGTWDRLRLQQVLSNLVSNAIKYGAGKPIRLRITREKGLVRLCVEDQGIGIAAADQARIFERFERAVSTRHYGGFGLGLWIVRQFVEAMGGKIRVESEVGKGSTFTVELPHHS